MKRYLIFFGFIVYISNSCFAGSISRKLWGNAGDTAMKLYNIDINENPTIRGLLTLEAFDVRNKTCYLTIKDKLVELNIPTGKWSVNSAVSPFLKKIRKENKPVNKIIVKNDTYYLSVLNDLYRIFSNGEITRIAHTYSFILSFDVTDSNSLLIATRDSILLMNNKGKLLSVRPIPMSDGSGYKMSSRGVCYSGTTEQQVYEFLANLPDSITVKEYAPIPFTKTIEEPYLSYVTDSYFICFPYKKRDVIYVLRKGEMKNVVYRKVQLKGFGFSPNADQLREEEGDPNFKIAYEDHVVYILTISKGKLIISAFTL